MIVDTVEPELEIIVQERIDLRPLKVVRNQYRAVLRQAEAWQTQVQRNTPAKGPCSALSTERKGVSPQIAAGLYEIPQGEILVYRNFATVDVCRSVN